MMLGAQDFAGRWRIDKRIDDRHAGQGGRFTGTGTFAPEGRPGLWRQAEDGELTLGTGPAFAARRAYLWAWDAAGVAVHFDDGRPFHRFVPDGLAAGTDHPCGADLYRVTYDFTLWPRWRATWEVTGPRKDYTMVAVWSPLT